MATTKIMAVNLILITNLLSKIVQTYCCPGIVPSNSIEVSTTNERRDGTNQSRRTMLRDEERLETSAHVKFRTGGVDTFAQSTTETVLAATVCFEFTGRLEGKTGA